MTFYGPLPVVGRPVELFCREIYWTEGQSPVGGRVSVEYTCDPEMMDQWIDDLPKGTQSDVIDHIELYHAPLDWGHNVAPQMLRIVQRKAES